MAADESQVIGTIVERDASLRLVLAEAGRTFQVEAAGAQVIGGGTLDELRPGVRITVRGSRRGKRIGAPLKLRFER
ncbi:MAG TPA: hypothetical protein VEA81_17090 [Burkholderiaceae bacterium]|nr:hypothetical protein [Burkholderiaceae bacterium]